MVVIPDTSNFKNLLVQGISSNFLLSLEFQSVAERLVASVLILTVLMPCSVPLPYKKSFGNSSDLEAIKAAKEMEKSYKTLF